MSKLARAIVLSVLALSIAGCASQQAGSPTQQTPSTASSSSSAVPAKLDPMDAADVTTDIAENFPTEVPVVQGEVLAGKAQGDDAWDYQLAVGADAPSTAAWYEQALGSRSWQVAERQEIARDGGNIIELTMVKGAAETRITVTPEGEGSVVSVVLGVGAPVLQTQ